MKGGNGASRAEPGHEPVEEDDDTRVGESDGERELSSGLRGFRDRDAARAVLLWAILLCSAVVPARADHHLVVAGVHLTHHTVRAP